MKKPVRLISLCMAICMIAGLFAGCGGKASSASSGERSAPAKDNGGEVEVLELKLSHNNAPTTDTGKEIQAWADRVYEASNGAIKINVYPSDTLGASNTFLDMLDTGVTDLQWASTVFSPDQFYYLDAFYLPMMGITSCEAGMNAFWDVYEQYPEVFAEEFKDYVPLIMYSSGAGVIGSNEPIHSVDDTKGLVIRTAGGTCTDLCEAIGSSPVSMGPGDVYTSMEKNVVDGYMFEWAGLDSFNLQDVTNYYIDDNIFRTVLCIWITRDKWDSFTDEQRAVFEQCCGREGSKYFTDMYQKQTDATIQGIIDAGQEIYYPTEEEHTGFVVAAEKVWNIWAERTTSIAGVEPMDYLNSVQEAIAKYAD